MTTKRTLTFSLLLGLVLMAGAADVVTLFSSPLAPDDENADQQLDCTSST